eukprot:13396188-Ditylum_brightwellii.AAC.1
MRPSVRKISKEKHQHRPSTEKNSLEKLITFLVNELTEDDYKVQVPVLKPLQSLFNKMFIRCGQTSVSVIGDMTWATLL